jgi:hypothetical protein
MKLQKQRTRKDKSYYKYVLVVPEEKIEKAEFKEGQELKVEAKKGRLLITSI